MLPFRFYLITDRLHARHDPVALLPRVASAGLRALQVREKDLTPCALAEFCRALQSALAGHPTPPSLFLNDRADLALSLGFAGVHLREESLPLSAQALALRTALRFGVSTHDLAGVRAAEEAGAEFATFGPVYLTASKAAYGEPVGLAALEAVARATRLPLLALGGVTPGRARECLAAGAWGVAAISAVWNAPDPVAALNAFAEALGGL
jgi:thiamine-phosphate pyrophosphorylase